MEIVKSRKSRWTQRTIVYKSFQVIFIFYFIRMSSTYLDIRGLGHEEESLKKAIELNIPALLIGETGTGKTSLIKKMAKDMGEVVVRVNLNGQTSTDEFVGKYVLEKGKMVWVDGVLTMCLRKGCWILVDEINAALPEILFVLHSLLDDERAILLSEKDGEVVAADPRFRFFATMNPVDEYSGTKDLNKALLSRFGCVLKVDYVDYGTEVDVVHSRTDVDYEIAKKIVTFALKTRVLKDQEKIFNSMSTRDEIGMAMLIKAGESFKRALELNYLNKLSKEEFELMKKEPEIEADNPASIQSWFTQSDVANAYTKGIKEQKATTEEIVKRLEKQIGKLTDSTTKPNKSKVAEAEDLPF